VPGCASNDISGRLLVEVSRFHNRFMIQRINTIKEIGRFKNLASGKGVQADFSAFNVVYALNASGKSTICDIMRSMSSGDPKCLLGRKRLSADTDPEVIFSIASEGGRETVRYQNGKWHNAENSPPVHVFDERFVAENVFVGRHIDIEQRRSLYGLVIGSKGVALRKAVDDAEEDLREKTTALGEATNALLRAVPKSWDTESFRMLEKVEDVDNCILEAEKNLQSASQTKGKSDAIRERKELKALNVASVPGNLDQVLAATLDDAALAAEQKIREHIKEHAEGLSIDWIGQGHRAQTGSGCPHCGQEMDGLEILQSYRAFFSGELQEQERLRNEIGSTVAREFGEMAQSRLREAIAVHAAEKAWWQDATGFEFELPQLRKAEEILSALGDAGVAMGTAFERKQANPGRPCDFSEAEKQSIAAWEDTVVELSNYNDGLAAVNALLAEKKTEAQAIDLAPLVEKVESLKASKSRHQDDVIKAYNDYDATSSAKQKSERAKKTANEALRDESNQLLANYGDRINELLKLFSADFRIVCGGEKGKYVTFLGGRPSGQLAIEIQGKKISSSPNDAANPARTSLANTLSGGDRSALALAFFLAVVEQDPDLSESVVVFDDPFHSQDRSRQGRTIEKIHEIVGQAKQCFVFSHDLEFARTVEKLPGVDSRSFFLNSLGEQVAMEAKEFPMLPSRAYEINYKRLSDFRDDLADAAHHPKEIAVTLRIILEEYLRLKFPLDWKENDWLGDMIGAIRGAQSGDVLFGCKHLETELAAVNNYSKRFHHRSTGASADVPDARELKSYVEQTLSIISK
jgi:wobble nucleotide-excising tRNase